MKWSHRALLRDEFLSEWQARDTAVHLAMQVAQDTDTSLSVRAICPAASSFGLLPVARVPALLQRRHKDLHVGFADHLDLLLGLDDELEMHQRSFCVDPFACGLTPWSHKVQYDDNVPVGHHNPLSSFGDLCDLRVPKWSFLRDEENSTMCPMYTIGSRSQGVGGLQTFSSRLPTDSLHVDSVSSTSSQSAETHRDEPEPPWAPCIWNLLRNEGVVEDEVEGPVVYVTSFFISHAHHRRCDEPRPLRFDVDFREWNHDVRVVCLEDQGL
eukprot:s3265_g10.t1